MTSVVLGKVAQRTPLIIIRGSYKMLHQKETQKALHTNLENPIFHVSGPFSLGQNLINQKPELVDFNCFEPYKGEVGVCLLVDKV